MKFFAPLALASLAAAAPSAMQQRAPSALDVELQMDGNSKVKATITNNGKNNLKILKTGTFLDTAAVEKAKVTSGDKSVQFDGLKLRVSPKSLKDSSFQRIAAGKSISIEFDVAEVHDLSAGGQFDILSSGVLGIAEEGSSELSGSVPYESNKISATVDGAKASASRAAFHEKRTTVLDCTGDRQAVTETALSNCARIAGAASAAASTGDAGKLEEYFKSSSSDVRSIVSGVFSAVSAECGSTTGGVSTYYCSDPYGACSDGVLAYTLPSSSYMAYCDLYFNELPALTTTCHGQDQANTNIHESTHLTEIKGTDDFGGYGYDFIQSLSPEQNINHADTYALYANAIDLGC